MAEKTSQPWAVRRSHGGGIYHHLTSASNDNIAAFARLEDAEYVARMDALVGEMTQFLREVCAQSDAKVPTCGIREKEAEALYQRALALINKATGGDHG